MHISRALYAFYYGIISFIRYAIYKLDGAAFYLSLACQLHGNDISFIQTQSAFHLNAT